tara:strand:+ start:1807 stop:2043 length:237 start_codon:yes stop_codon:yes gene_type:complete
MKKLVLVLVFVFCATAMNAQDPDTDHCGSYAVAAADAEYPDEDTAWDVYYEAYQWYLEACFDSVSDGREIMMPIFLEL